MESFSQILWLFFIITALQPVLQKKMLLASRQRLIRRIEQQRSSRVIALVHRQEVMSLLGFPLMRYINIEDSEELLRAIDLTEPETPIDLVLHTPGGLVLASVQIARAIKRHPGRITVIVPHYAMSGGTLIAIAADEIVMSPNAVLGPTDPQVSEAPAASILEVLERKSIDHVDDQTIILADVARKAIAQLRSEVGELLEGSMAPGDVEILAELLSQGRWTHDHPITADEAKSLGLSVETDIPPDFVKLMALYPQPTKRQRSVEYLHRS